MQQSKNNKTNFLIYQCSIFLQTFIKIYQPGSLCLNVPTDKQSDKNTTSLTEVNTQCALKITVKVSNLLALGKEVW